jgi:hypothetical protein
MPKRNPYPLGQRFALLHVETFYPVLDAGLCTVGAGSPLPLHEGAIVRVIHPGPTYATYVKSAALVASDRVLCETTVNGAPAYGWVALSWLEPLTPQRSLFEAAQPSLF